MIRILSLVVLMPMLLSVGIQGKKLTVNEILKKTEATYANAVSYMDSGYLKTKYLHKDKKKDFETTAIFSTAFLRRGRFRFEYALKEGKDTVIHYIVWRNKEDIRTFSNIGGEEKQEALHRGIAAATGISAGTAHTIPQLLMPKDIVGNSILGVKDPVLLDEGTDEDNVMCYRIKFDNRIVWIQKRTFLITKIEKITKFRKSDDRDEFSIQSITVYRPKVNVAVPKDKLTFKRRAEVVNDSQPKEGKIKSHLR